MNERIKTLCQKAFNEAQESRVGADGLIRSDGNPYIFYEKLALLVIRECADLADSAEPFQTSDLILKHFGVQR